MFFRLYATLWVLFCLCALGILLKEQKHLRSEWEGYLRFLCIPWKLAFFVPAFLFVTFAGRFTNDETWDMITGSGMSILTFLTAPLCVGLVYQVLKGKKPPRFIIVSIALCLFSSSWFYDGYLYLRDGAYTSRWLGNLMLSPIIYVAAGFLCSLEAKDSFRYTLSFLRPDWPKPPSDKRFRPLLLISIPLIMIAAFVLVAFVRWHF
jgi:hypothetical protein